MHNHLFKDARDHLQTQLLLSRRVKQAFGRGLPPVRDPSPGIARKLVIQSSRERQSRKSVLLPVAVLLSCAAGTLIWVGWLLQRTPITTVEETEPEWLVAQGDLRAEPQNIAADTRTSESKTNALAEESGPVEPSLRIVSGQPAQMALETPGVRATGRAGFSRKNQRVVGLEREVGPLEIALGGSSASGAEEALLGAPVGPDITLKRLAFDPPRVLKLKNLSPQNLREIQGRGSVRIDLPTYREAEAVKRLVKTLSAQGCQVVLDQPTRDRLKKSGSLGSVSISVWDLEPEKLGTALQDTSKVIGGKPGINQPVSVFEEMIVHALVPPGADLGDPRETTSPTVASAASAGPREPRQATAFIQMGLLGRPGHPTIKGQPSSAIPPTAFSVLLQIFPLR